MSDWDVADSAWSSVAEVIWLECEGKEDHIVPDCRMSRGTSSLSGECLPKAAGEPLQGALKISDQIRQRIWKLDHPDTNIKGQSFKDSAGQEAGYNVKGRVSFLSTGVWCDCSPGTSFADLSLSASNRCDSTIKSGPAVELKSEISWYSFDGGVGMCKDESGYHSDGSDIINSSCHFLLSDICPPGGDLEFLSESQEEVRRDNLLEYGWGNTNNLEDMEKLFSISDSMLSRGFDNNDGMLWEPPSLTLGDSQEIIHQPVSLPVSPQLATSSVVKCFEGNSNSSTSIDTVALSIDETGSGEEWRVRKANISVDLKNLCLSAQIDNYTEFRKENTSETQEASDGGSRDSDNMEDEASHIPEEIDKCKTQAKQHGSRSKRLEENSRKAISQRKIALGLERAKKSPLLYVPVVSIAQDTRPCSKPVAQVTRISSSEPMSSILCLQPVPYAHAGFGFLAHHHVPVVIPSPVIPQQQQLQGQPVFTAYQPSYIDAPKFQQSKCTYDVSSQSSTASSTMTPQEKIEKLRLRQKMQARLAVEQQQKFINQRLIPDQIQCGRQNNHCIHPQGNSSEEDLSSSVGFAQSQGAEPLVWNEKSVSLEGTMSEDGDEFLCATVLHQLLNIASNMDIRTRLCLRDGFHRLAGNAMQRGAAGDTQSTKKKKNSEPADRSCIAESSSSSEQSCSQRLLTVDDIVETETNPMDRFIAHLLFHRRFPSLFTP